MTILSDHAILAVTAPGFILGIIAGARREACRSLSRLGLVVNACGLLYVFLALLV